VMHLAPFLLTLAAFCMVTAPALAFLLPTDQPKTPLEAHHRLERTRVERVWIELTLTNLTPSSRSGPAVHALEGWWVGRPPARYQIGAKR